MAVVAAAAENQQQDNDQYQHFESFVLSDCSLFKDFFDLADLLLNLAGKVLGLALRLHVRIAGGLAQLLFNLAFQLVELTRNLILGAWRHLFLLIIEGATHGPRVEMSLGATRRNVSGTSISASTAVPQAGIAVKWNVDPVPGVDSIHMRPPCHSMAFLQNASPSPLPGYSFPCRRLNGSNRRPWKAGSIPGPLSCTENTHSRSSGLHEMCTRGEGLTQYSMAFLIRWCMTLTSISKSPMTAGKGSWVTIALRSAICLSAERSAWRRTASMSVREHGRSPGPFAQ